ncbi:MAG: HAMP domain-containing sensor histidine kinase [Balneolaceae bacterium]|nr:HAMP domain-containing sensor histidine kinase [Balneolaceae bacterium]
MNNLQGSDLIDKEKKAPIPENELERVLELTELDLDYTTIKESLGDLNKLAAHVAGTEISLINLIDSYTQWSVSSYGIDAGQLPREESVCQYTIMSNEDFEVKNLKEDDRFNMRDFVTNNPTLEYYYGTPLTSSNGNNLGALCVLDQQEKELTPEKIELLNIIAKEIVTRLESLHKIDELKQTLSKVSELPRKVLHDIRGPVGGIIGLAQIIKSEAEEKNFDDILELIELINKGGKSVLELADEILSAHSEKEDNEANEPKKNQFTLVLLQDKLEQLFKPQAKSKNVNLAININGDNQQLVFPKQKLLQIIGNLISNAVKFTPEFGEVTVDLILKPLTNDQPESHTLHVTVSDTGVGMEPETLEIIREQDINMDNESTTGTSGEKGHGFGIQLVKHLVQTIDGQLKITSTKGEGTSVEVLVPLNAE